MCSEKLRLSVTARSCSSTSRRRAMQCARRLLLSIRHVTFVVLGFTPAIALRRPRQLTVPSTSSISLHLLVLIPP